MRQTTPLREGAVLVTKEMKGTDGAEFPSHTASLESVLVVMDGSCTISFGDVVHELRAGDTFVVPPTRCTKSLAPRTSPPCT